MFLQLVN